MVATAALVIAFGIALAQFYRVLVLLPATVIGAAGVVMVELAAGHSPVHTLLSVVLAVSALQVGFLSSSFFGGLVVGASKRASTAAPKPK